MRYLRNKKIYSAILSGFLILIFILAPLSHTFETRRVEAAIDYDPFNTVVNTMSSIANKSSAISNMLSSVSNGISAAAMKSLGIKEFALDAIAWSLVNITLKEMIRSTTKWVNSGFKGSPAFVTDFEGFLLDIADKVAGNFIWGSGLDFLCSPFKINLRLALDLQYQGMRGGYRAQCRLSSVIKNVDRFLEGDFIQGGWDGWYNVALIPQNNPYGAMLDAQSGLYFGISGKKEQRVDILKFGNGFLPVEECWDDEFGGQRCETVTPGTAIESQLNSALNLPMQRLAVADELNELLGALMTQLAKEALGGVGGLLGLTESRKGYAGNYFSRMNVEQTPTVVPITSTNPFSPQINSETRYRNLQTTVVALIGDAGTYRARVYPDIDEASQRGPSCESSGTLPNSLQNQLLTSQREIASSTRLIATLNQFMNDYASLSGASTSASTTQMLLARYNGTSIPETQSQLINTFLQYQTSGALHTDEQAVTLELRDLPNIREQIQSFTASVDTACARRTQGIDTSGSSSGI